MKSVKHFYALLFFSILIVSSKALAVGAGITYHGRLIDPNGHPVTGSAVQFKIQIRTPGNENCLMYEEVQVKDMSTSEGVFSVTINDGTGSRLDTSGYGIDQVFANRGTFNFAGGQCAAGTTYIANANDGRKIQLFFNDGTMGAGTWEPNTPMPINFVPMAIEALQIGGYKKEQLLKLADGVTTTGSELDATKWTNLQALINGTSTAYTKPTDQVTQLYGASIPAPVTGQSIRWNGALNAGSGGWENFTPGAAVSVTNVTAGTGLNVGAGPGGSITTTGTLNIDVGTTTGKIVQVAASNKLPAIDGSNLTSVNASSVGGTTVSLAALSNGQVLKYDGTNWVNATLTDNDTLGGLSCASGRVAYYSGSWGCLEVTSANTINTIVSRDGSGTSTFGTVNTGSLKVNNGVASDVTLTTPAAFTSYAMKLPTSVGTSGYVLTTDGGSPAQLSWSPMTASQWTTSGSNIYYNTGNVGIGTTSPGAPLDVAGTNSVKIVTAAGTSSTLNIISTSGYNKTDGNNTQFDWPIYISIPEQTDFYNGIAFGNVGGSGPFAAVVAHDTNGGSFYVGGLEFRTRASGGNLLTRMAISDTGNVGIGTSSPSFALSLGDGSAVDGAIMAKGYGTVGTDGQTLAVSGAGTRMFWYPKKASFRAGIAGTTTWNDANIGLYSVAFGNTVQASGAASVALGQLATASGDISFAMGEGCNSSGSRSVCLGYNSLSSGALSSAYGVNSVASGDRANTLGMFVSAESYAQTTVGTFNLPKGAETSSSWVSTDPLFVVGNGTGSGVSRSNAMMILKNGNVGIGTASPNYKLDVVGNINVQGLVLNDMGALARSGNNLEVNNTTSGVDAELLLYTNNAGVSSERLRITKTGNVGVGTTTPAVKLEVAGSATTATIGTEDVFHLFRPNPNSAQFPSVAAFKLGSYGAGPSPTTRLDIDLKSSGDNTDVANVNVMTLQSNGNVGIGTTSPQTTLQVAGVISPATNNTYTLGNATYRFTEVYATNGVINTSDRREKKDIYNTDLGLDFINKLRPVSYRWNTGIDNDVHYGLIAQEAEQAITEVGKTEKTSIVTHDETTDRYGVRYSELIAPLIKAVQELYSMILGIERTLASVKADKIEIDVEIQKLKLENEKLKQENAAKAKEMTELKVYLCSKDKKAPICK